MIEELEQYRVKSSLVPDTIYYIPNFISPEEEAGLIGNVLAAPKPKWTYLANRSLQNWGGLPHPKGMVPERLPDWLTVYTRRLGKMGLFEGKEPNHILMNRYEPNQGIMAHEDGPLFYPTVTTINTGSHSVLNFYAKPAEEDSTARRYVFSLLLWPRSLLVLRHQAYTSYLHEIEELTTDMITRQGSGDSKNFANLDAVPAEELKPFSVDQEDRWTIPRQTRYSFTIRHVPKVFKSTAFLEKLLYNK